MSYICLKCESTVILDPTSVSEIFQSGDGSMKIPEATKQEFSVLKDEMIELFRDFLPDPQKYKSDTHMLCESCLHSLLLAVEKDITLEEAKKFGFINEMKSMEEDVQKTEKKLEELKINEEHEAKLRENLKMVNDNEGKQKEELEELGRLQTHCEESEEIYWEEALKFESKLFLLNEKKNTVNKQIKEVQHELDKLNRVNILNDLIHISTDHEVAKINDLQLGKMYTASGVNWTETNAALGQLVLLFAILEEKCREMKYEKIKMKPQGSFSEVIRVTHDKEEKYELVGPPKDELRFNSGLFTLLEAMTQIHHHLSTKLGHMIQGGLYDLPHQILGENIGGIPFKYHGSKLDKWTEVLKYFSLNCKHLIYLFSLYEKNSQIAIKANSEV